MNFKLLIIHGEDQVASRTFYLSQRQAATAAALPLVEIDGLSATLDQVVNSVQSVSLFGPQNFTCLENLFSRRPSNAKTAIIEFLTTSLELPLLVWESKDVSAQLKKFPPTAIRKFDLPKHIFTYLDHFSLPNLKLALSSTSSEQIFALLVRRVQQLIQVKSGLVMGTSWQQTKLQQQSAQFSLEQLVSLHDQLVKIDSQQKTSNTPLNLAGSLELWTIKAVI